MMEHLCPLYTTTHSLLTEALILQCYLYIGYEATASSPELEHFHYALPETFFAPLAVATVYLLHGPNSSSGRSRHEAPVPKTHTIPASTLRCSLLGRPVGGFCGGISGLMRSHFSSVRRVAIGVEASVIAVAGAECNRSEGRSRRRRSRLASRLAVWQRLATAW